MSSSEENQLQAIQIASAFAEKPIKELLMSLLKRNEEILFGGDKTPDESGIIKIGPIEGETFCIRLELVDSNYRIPMHRFGKLALNQGQIEILRLFMAAELYFAFAKHVYGLYDECSLWRSRHGSLFIAGSPVDAHHISVVFL